MNIIQFVNLALVSLIYNMPAAPFIAPPIITEPPIEGTVRQDENAIFSCKAEGYPLPTISWMHKGMIVTEHHPDYLVSPSINKENTTFSSDLRIFSTRVLWTGEVTCIASADSPEHSGIVLADHSANTSLTVLGIIMFYYM